MIHEMIHVRANYSYIRYVASYRYGVTGIWGMSFQELHFPAWYCRCGVNSFNKGVIGTFAIRLSFQSRPSRGDTRDLVCGG